MLNTFQLVRSGWFGVMEGVVLMAVPRLAGHRWIFLHIYISAVFKG